MSNQSARRIVLLTEGHTEPITGKTAVCVLRYRPEEVVALLDTHEAGKTAGAVLNVGGAVPIVARLADAPSADTLMVGIAPSGGKIPASWKPTILEAIGRGMNVVSGLHDFLCNDADLVAAANQHGVELLDVRKNNERDVADKKNLRDGCVRIHTVGHDCCVGKMVVALEVARALIAQGRDAKFIASGQTGIMIEGDGCPVDCVVSDFVSGAVEKLILANQHHEFLLIEGQGSLAHPRYSGVTLGLLHGCAPQGMIMCYEAGRSSVHGMPYVPLQPLDKLVRIYEDLASLMGPSRVIGVGMNSRRLGPDEAEAEREKVSRELGLPVCDVFRHGAGVLAEAVVQLTQSAAA